MTNKVLILHGWEDDSKKGFIPELVKTLKEKGYSPHAVDLPNTKKPKFEEWFASAEKEIEKIGKDNLIVVGHSMGGFLSLKLAEKYKIDRLILLTPVGSKPSEKYFEEMGKKLSKEELEVFRKYQDRALDVAKVKANAKEIVFLFGKKDPWITEEIREFYTKNFKDVAKIEIFENHGHMSDSEGVKKLSEVEKLFENKAEEKTEKKDDKKEKAGKVKIVKKEEAVARGDGLRMSKRHAMYISQFIKNKNIDEAIKMLEEVKLQKRAVPFKGEIPHRKGNIMAGRYPIKAAGIFITMLKGLRGNVITNGMDLDKTVIYFSMPNWGARPKRRLGSGKRTNIIIKAKEVEVKN